MHEAVLEKLARVLTDTNRTLSVAESCTGGMIGAALTSVPGSSRWFKGGVIAYANDVKESVLGVPRETLDSHGAVSGETVVAMAEGVRKLLGTDCAIAVSGVAGPDGGTEEKPVGLVWIATIAGESAETREYRFDGDRERVRLQTLETSLGLMSSLIQA